MDNRTANPSGFDINLGPRTGSPFGPLGGRNLWGYGFGPRFGAPPSDQHMRVGDAERRAAADRLGEHFADGRLDQGEFDERVSRAMTAKTRADLTELFTDLPETGAPAAPVRPRRGRARSALVLVAMIGIIMIAAHALLAVAPLLWLGFFAVALLFATRSVGHHRSAEEQGR
jgi:hypothetical protein